MSICQSKNWIPFEDTMDHDFDQFARDRQETRDFDMFLKERHNSERYKDFFYISFCPKVLDQISRLSELARTPRSYELQDL